MNPVLAAHLREVLLSLSITVEAVNLEEGRSLKAMTVPRSQASPFLLISSNSMGLAGTVGEGEPHAHREVSRPGVLHESGMRLRTEVSLTCRITS